MKGWCVVRVNVPCTRCHVGTVAVPYGAEEFARVAVCDPCITALVLPELPAYEVVRAPSVTSADVVAEWERAGAAPPWVDPAAPSRWVDDEYLAECARVKAPVLVVGENTDAAAEVLWRYVYLVSTVHAFSLRTIGGGMESSEMAQVAFVDLNGRAAARRVFTNPAYRVVRVENIGGGGWMSEGKRFEEWGMLGEQVRHSGQVFVGSTSLPVGGDPVKAWGSGSVLGQWVGPRGAGFLRSAFAAGAVISVG